MIGYVLNSGWTDSSSEVISRWETSSWGSTCCWTTLVAISLVSVIVSSGNCETFSSVTDVPEIVGVTGVSVLTEMGESSNLDEEPEVLDVLDSVKRDHFHLIGVASGGKGGFLSVLH